MDANEQEPMHWEAIIRAIIEKIGPDGLFEVIDYVIADMAAADDCVVNFIIN